MIPDFPHNIRIRLARLIFLLLCPDVAQPLPCWLSQFRKAKLRQGRDRATLGRNKKIQLGQSYSYIMENLVSSNLNSKLFKLYCVRPNFYIMGGLCLLFPELSRIYTKLQTNCTDNRCKLLLATTTINIGSLAYVNFTSVENFFT